MNPKAIRNPAMVRGTDGLLRLEVLDAGREFVLDPLAELIWDLSDGSRDIEALAEAAGRAFDRVVHKEEVFSALDFLADAGLIEERVAPPVAEGKVSRRSLLVRIGPVVGAAAWVMSGFSARAGGLQYNESASKESDRKASDRERDNKESGNKAVNSESDNKERGNKAATSESDNKERGNKKHDQEYDDKQDWNRQQDAEKQRKSEFRRSMDRINESERKHAIVSEQLEQKMRASWPKLYDLVGHKLSEFPGLRQVWEKAKAGFLPQTLTADNYDELFRLKQAHFGIKLRILDNLRDDPWRVPRALFAKAGFDFDWPPFLAGDSQKKTYLVLKHVQDPAIDDNWRYALDADNLRFEFGDVEAAYQFLSSRRTAGRQMKK